METVANRSPHAPPSPARRVRGRYVPKFAAVLYIIVTTFVGLAAMSSQVNLLFAVFGLLVGGLLTNVLGSGAVLRGMDVQRLARSPGVVDEPMVLQYRLTNRKWFMPTFGVLLRELDGPATGALRGEPHGWLLHLGPRAATYAEAACWAARRGRVGLRRIELSTTFPFGLVEKRVVFEQAQQTVVYPRLHRLQRRLLAEVRAREPSGTRPGNHSGGSEEFIGLREYQHGDRIKNIDWKRSAHHGELLTREMTRLSPTRLMVLLDLRPEQRSSEDIAERAISLAASVICEAHRDGFEVGLCVVGANGPTWPPRHSRWHRMEMLRALAEIDLQWPVEHATELPGYRQAFWLIVHAGPADRTIGPRQALRIPADQSEGWMAETEAARPSASSAA